MKISVATTAAAAGGIALLSASTPSAMGSKGALSSATFTLPSEAAAKAELNSTWRHREWVSIPVGSTTMRAFIVYPERADKGPVVLLTAKKQSASDWIRAVGDQVAASGFIAAVPDILSGQGPNGGDTDSFRSAGAVEAALDHLGPAEVERRNRALLQYATALPAANGKAATLEFDAGRAWVDAKVDSAGRAARFPLTSDAWPQALDFLTRQTGNKPVAGANPNVPEDHSAHMQQMMLLAQNDGRGDQPAARGGRGGPRGYPQGKLPELPAGVFNAKSTLVNSKLRKEFVDIPLGDVKLHTWVEYPDGEGKAPIVIVMQHGPGMDDWQRALTDQLALQGFIAVAADLHSGLGPNGGNYESFIGTDEVMRATARLTPDEMMRRYKTALNWALKLPRSSGKIASVGFCMGGGNSFRFATEVPELNAAVSFYGTPPDKTLAAKIKAPVLAFYGEEDARVTATMQPTEALMKDLGKSFEAHSYPHATHGFLEFQDLAGNPQATADSWPRTIAFLNQYLK